MKILSHFQQNVITKFQKPVFCGTYSCTKQINSNRKNIVVSLNLSLFFCNRAIFSLQLQVKLHCYSVAFCEVPDSISKTKVKTFTDLQNATVVVILILNIYWSFVMLQLVVDTAN